MPNVDTYLPIQNILPYLLIAAVFEALAVYLYQFRKIPGARSLVYCQVSKTVWVASLAFCSLQQDLPSKIFWIRFTEWAAVSLIYFWFIFILEISQQREKILAIMRYIVQGIVAFFSLVILLDKDHTWYWAGVSLQGQVLTIGIGPAGWLAIFFCYLLNVICFGLSVRWVLKTRGLRRQQAIVLSVTPVFTLLGNILGRIPGIEVVSPQIIGLLLSALYVTWAFYRWRVYSILPLAQDAITDNMIDGLMVVDEKGYIVDMNPAAQTIFMGLPAVVGGKFKEVAAAWPVLAGIADDFEPGTLEAVRDLSSRQRIYQIQTLLLKTPQAHILGKTIILEDITEQKQAQAKMVEQQKALSIMSERERLGRELHDGHGQIWSYIHMQVEAARSFLSKKDWGQTDSILEKVAGVTQDMHVDIRESITGLQLTAGAEQGVWQALEEYVQWFQQNYGIHMDLNISNDFAAGILAPTTEVQLLRIIQEALTNIRKYAKACRVKVNVNVTGNLAEVSVEDDGCGFELAAALEKKSHFGLKIMRERAAEIGAQFTIQSKPDQGTKVILQVPLAGRKEALP